MDERQRDRELLKRVQASDREALGELFTLYQPILFRQLVFQTGRPELAHDLIQETFLRVWDHRKTLRPSLSFLAYTLKISRNLLVDTVRYRQTREKYQEALPFPAASEGDDPEEAVELTMLEEALAGVIYEDLPERCRTVLILSRFEGRSSKEIASVLGTSVRTVEHQMSRALKILRQRLSAYMPKGDR